MKLPKVKKGELVCEDSSGQIQVLINPKKKAPKTNGVDNSKYDIVCLRLKSLEGDEREQYMTPDEALAISSLLAYSVQMWLLASSEGYRKEILTHRVIGANKREKKHNK